MALVLIIIGAYFDEYQYAFTSLNDIPFIVFANKAIQFIGGSRHALFFALPMILIGKFLEEHKIFFNASKTTCVTLLIVSFFVSLVECIILRYYGGENITCDITLFNYIPAIFLFILTFLHQPKAFSGTSTRTLRKAADVLYISHVLILHAVDKVFEVEYLLRFLLVLVASLIVSSLYVGLERTKEKSPKK